MTKDNYYLSPGMKKYINSSNEKYKVGGGGNLIVNRTIACTKSTREGSTRADSSDYICKELMENENIKDKDMTKYRIRKLTPRECGRLMDVSDDDITKMLSVVSNAQAYKQFGNGIVVKVIELIMRNLIEE